MDLVGGGADAGYRDDGVTSMTTVLQRGSCFSPTATREVELIREPNGQLRATSGW